MCSGEGPTPFVWATTGLASQNTPDGAPLSTRVLSDSTTDYSRYTSTTPTGDANPAQLTISDLLESEDGATVQCLDDSSPTRISSNILSLRIGE